MWKTILDRALAEDRANEDVTVRAAGVRGDAEFVLKIKQDGVFCGRGLLDCLSDFGLQVETRLTDGQTVQAGTVGARIVGGAAVTLGLERSLLNLLSYASGVATHTRHVVSHVGQKAKELGISAPRVLATRKTHAGLRDVALAGVRAGGGDVHRQDLASAVLVKDNHLKLIGGIRALDAEKMRGAFLEVARFLSQGCRPCLS
jgi:nicotinate-nucleotide pyrophosphorylase (carboxylating)